MDKEKEIKLLEEFLGVELTKEQIENLKDDNSGVEEDGKK